MDVISYDEGLAVRAVSAKDHWERRERAWIVLLGVGWALLALAYVIECMYGRLHYARPNFKTLTQ